MFKNISPDLVLSGKTCPANLGVQSGQKTHMPSPVEPYSERPQKPVPACNNVMFWTALWQHSLSSFQTGDKRLEGFLPKNKHTQRKLLNFQNWCNREVSKSAKIWLSKSICNVKNLRNLSQFFFHWRISHYWHFLITSIFNTVYFLKWCSIFDSSSLHQFSKFNHFLWVCWFLR